LYAFAVELSAVQAGTHIVPVKAHEAIIHYTAAAAVAAVAAASAAIVASSYLGTSISAGECSVLYTSQ
jgi:hypothetical protein